MKEALKQVSLLVERFERNIEAYRSPAYNETQLRREFIDPFFEALGWDVANKAGYAEQYKDVVHEDAIKVAGATKAPDYCFRIGGVRKFFLETKKPSVDIKGQVSPAYQLRRYAWSAKLPLSILTDFEEMAIYDCRLRPRPSDKPSIGRVRLYTYPQYPDLFEEVYNFLSKEAVLKGSFDKFAESEKQKRGTTEVDAEFLKEIESWRETLAKNIAIENPRLSVRELNYAVQDQVADVQQSIRSAMEILLRDLRMTGFDDDNINSTITITNPIIYPLKDDSITVNYEYYDKTTSQYQKYTVAYWRETNSSRLIRQLTTNDVAGSQDILLENVDALNFTYGVDANGDGALDRWVSAVDVGSNRVIAVRVTLTARPTQVNPDLQRVTPRTLTSAVTLRNLCMMK